MKYCTHCGNQVDDECIICPKCGCYADKQKEKKTAGFDFGDKDPNASPLSRTIDAIICFVLGGIGVHCFYEGKIGKGVLYIFTVGLFGIGTLIDFIRILMGQQKDKNGLPITNWNID